MYIYDITEHNQTGTFFRLANSMRQAKENGRGFTIFIGAGCSLSSSSEDISTSKIIENCLKENFNPNYKTPDSWEGLYRDFVNNIWAPCGNINKQEILKKYFLGLIPSIGYQNLRKLVEYGFITDIVTTNFDMLIDEALDNLAYTVQVGNLKPRRIKGGSRINLYKIHGDIESGELRFSPNELRDLPKKISKIINLVSANSCIFCGYSGQDQGLMKSLEKNSDYNVFWASPKKPIKDDVYGTKDIYDWLSARNSESNFIYGNDIGNFDNLMGSLVCNLIEGKNIIGIMQWKFNTICETLQINKRVFSIFQQLLQCSASIRQQYKWQKRFPFYSNDYETTLSAYLYYYDNQATLPTSLLQIPENEVEALIMGLAIEILSSTSGIDLSIDEYTNKVKKDYEKNNPIYCPDTSFWAALNAVLTSIENNAPLQNGEDYSDVFGCIFFAYFFYVALDKHFI